MTSVKLSVCLLLAGILLPPAPTPEVLSVALAGPYCWSVFLGKHLSPVPNQLSFLSNERQHFFPFSFWPPCSFWSWLFMNVSSKAHLAMLFTVLQRICSWSRFIRSRIDASVSKFVWVGLVYLQKLLWLRNSHYILKSSEIQNTRKVFVQILYF